MTSSIADLYLHAKDSVIQNGYSDEIEWQASRKFCNVTEEEFLRESAWVILGAGMKEKVTREKFPGISACFFLWREADLIVRNEEHCVRAALSLFNHPGKINAIVAVARRVQETGFSRLKELIESDPLGTLRSLPYIGPVTCFHLAKNLGIPVAKPDRHLVRIAESLGYNSVQTMCLDVSELSGDDIPVVDIVLWRFATIDPNYVQVFSSYGNESISRLD